MSTHYRIYTAHRLTIPKQPCISTRTLPAINIGFHKLWRDLGYIISLNPRIQIQDSIKCNTHDGTLDSTKRTRFLDGHVKFMNAFCIFLRGNKICTKSLLRVEGNECMRVKEYRFRFTVVCWFLDVGGGKLSVDWFLLWNVLIEKRISGVLSRTMINSTHLAYDVERSRYIVDKSCRNRTSSNSK